MDPQANSRPEHRLGFVPEPDAAAHPDQNPLSDLEQIALTTGMFATEESARSLWAQLDAWAGQLGDPEKRSEARIRHIARMVASLRMKILLHERRRDEMLHAGDMNRTLALDRFLQTDGRRLEALLREHREACRGGARIVQIAALTIGDRPQVSVVAGRAG